MNDNVELETKLDVTNENIECSDTKVFDDDSKSSVKVNNQDDQASLVINQEDFKHLKLVSEALLMASEKPMTIKALSEVFIAHNEDPNTRVRDRIKFNKKYINLAIDELKTDYENSSIEIKLLGTGFRIQTKASYATWVQRLWQEKPSKYSKATLETLAIIAYRQPITRGEIENIRGVAVSSQIIRNLYDREWIKVVGHKELPGKPAIYATTSQFLADLNLEKLDELPTLADIKEIKQDLFQGLDDANASGAQLQTALLSPNSEIKTSVNLADSDVLQYNDAIQDGNVIQDSDVIEDSRVIEDSSIIEDSSVTEDSSVVEDSSVIDDSSVIEDSSVVEDSSVIDDSSVIEDSSVNEDSSVIDDSDVNKESYAISDSGVIDDTDSNQDSNSIQHADLNEDNLAKEYTE